MSQAIVQDFVNHSDNCAVFLDIRADAMRALEPDNSASND